MTDKPPFRKLRGYAFDPSLSQSADTVDINTITYKIPWEDLRENPKEHTNGLGPKGEYVEVIDFDPTIGKFYTPVDLDHPYVIARDGLAPSEGNPQFHQQMVYAVAMTTIKNFEKALGRKIIWSPRCLGGIQYQEYVQRLRIYPHALREANAFYSPLKKALLFGYFSATPADDCLHMPGSLVFTCLSHDIIAHETTHAILDGMHRYYNNPTNPDVLAFHEAFADIVALFQHFTFPEVLKKQIAETRGDLGAQNLLGKLAQEFGAAIGSYGSLRDAIGDRDETGKWIPKKPNTNDYRTVMEPHGRGSILVAAVFEAFINIYKSKVADLLRIASNGTGVLPQGELHPDLVNRLADEAAKIARHVLQMCIRALDYCPPVDISFGDFLRAVITADMDLVVDDHRNYRLFFIEAFRHRGIYPQGIKTLSVESLRYPLKPAIAPQINSLFGIIVDFLRAYRNEIMYVNDRKKTYDISQKYMGGTDHLSLHKRLSIKFGGSADFERLTGLVFGQGWERLGIRTSKAYGDNGPGPSFQIQNLRLVSRVGPDNNQINQIIFSIVQRSGVIVKDDEFTGHYQRISKTPPPPGGFELWGGCTLIFDLDTLELKYAISRPLLDMSLIGKNIRQIDQKRAESQSRYWQDMAMGMSEYHNYFSNGPEVGMDEPFAFLHQH